MQLKTVETVLGRSPFEIEKLTDLEELLLVEVSLNVLQTVGCRSPFDDLYLYPSSLLIFQEAQW